MVAPPCQHYWVIPPATGPVGVGTCKKCGEVKTFANSMPGPRLTTPLEGSKARAGLYAL